MHTACQHGSCQECACEHVVSHVVNVSASPGLAERWLSPCGPLFVHVDDVFYQEVPLQAVNTVSVQDHLVSAGWTAEAASRHR